MKNRPIGIFDSGVGGLTVLREVERILPSEDIVYFGDTARVPYGNKSKNTIVKFSTENILFLLKNNVKAIIVACNTSSSLALSHLTGVFNIPIIGVIESGVLKALKKTKSKKIGIVGTRSTIESKSYIREIVKRDGGIEVYSQSCPLFVPLVEEGILSGKIVDEVMKMYLDEFKAVNIDTLILGCTHYPLLKKKISRYLKNVFIVDSAKEVACYTRDILKCTSRLRTRQRKGRVNFYVSDEPKSFAKLAKLFLSREISWPKVVSV